MFVYYSHRQKPYLSSTAHTGPSGDGSAVTFGGFGLWWISMIWRKRKGQNRRERFWTFALIFWTMLKVKQLRIRKKKGILSKNINVKFQVEEILCFEISSHTAGGRRLKLVMYSRMTLNFWSSWLSLLNEGITNVWSGLLGARDWTNSSVHVKQALYHAQPNSCFFFKVLILGQTGFKLMASVSWVLRLQRWATGLGFKEEKFLRDR